MVIETALASETLWLCEADIHSLSPTAHDVGQDETEDQRQGKGNDDGDDVVGEEISVGRRLWRTELSTPRQDTWPHGGHRSTGNRLGQIELVQKRDVRVKVSYPLHRTPCVVSHQDSVAPVYAVDGVCAGATVSADLSSGHTLSLLLRRLKPQHTLGEGLVWSQFHIDTETNTGMWQNKVHSVTLAHLHAAPNT